MACAKAGLLGAMLVLAGCGVGGFSLEKAEVDRSLVTSSVSGTPAPTDPGVVADQATIRNVVSSVDVEQQAGKPLAWANPETGARGTITGMAQTKAGGHLCRSFGGSRENFDGVSMFRGEACMIGPNLWRMERFDLL